MKRGGQFVLFLVVVLAAFGFLAAWKIRESSSRQGIERAYDALSQGDAVAAQSLLEQAYRSDPRADGGRVAFELGTCHLSLGDFARAESVWTSLPRPLPSSLRDLVLQRARETLSQHRYAEAEGLFLLLTEGNDSVAIETAQSLALIYKIEGRLAETKALFHRCLVWLPEKIITLRELWDIDTAAYPASQMRGALDLATKSAPNDAGVRLASAHLDIVTGDLEGAREKLERCLKEPGFNWHATPWSRDIDRFRTTRLAPEWHHELQRCLLANDAQGLRRALGKRGHALDPAELAGVWAWVGRARSDTRVESDALENLMTTPSVDTASLERCAELAMLEHDVEKAATLRAKKAEIDRKAERYRDILFFSADPLGHAVEAASLSEALGRAAEARTWLLLALRRNPDDANTRRALQKLKDPTLAHPAAPPHSYPTIDKLLAALDMVTGQALGLSAIVPMLNDDAETVGLRFQYEPGRMRQRRPPETMGSGLAILDFDRDGWPDVFMVQGGMFPPRDDALCADRLFRNRGDGTFDDVTDKAGFPMFPGGYGLGVTVGDIDNDGFPDLFVTRWRSYALYRNKGDGTFEDVTEPWGLAGERDWPSSAAFADIDNDGDVDLYVCHYFVWDEAHAQGSRPDRAPDSTRYNNPLNFLALPDHLFRNDGGRFTDISREAGVTAVDTDGRGLGVVAADFDGDGLIDFYVANDLTANFLFRNKGDGTFEDLGQLNGVAGSAEGLFQGSMGIACGDLDGDGRLDLAVTNFYGDSMAVYRGLGRGLFADYAASLGLKISTRYMVGWGIAFLDFNNDTRPDMIFTNGHLDLPPGGAPFAMLTQVFVQQPSGMFLEVTTECCDALRRPRVGRALAAGDLDNDGRIDALVATHDTPVLYLHNQTERSGHFLEVQLEGTHSNRDAIGAIVIVHAGEKRWLGGRFGGCSYQSSSDPRIHFGLGDLVGIDRVTIRWPSGTEQTFIDLDINRGYRLVEGQTKAEPLPGFEPGH